MKVYLVGGAVRDQLLGYPVKERDWVVVGATPEDLLKQGYQQVGRDFPVFLHPTTHEEYALARTERKQAAGYYGFVCDANPLVTLKEDLARRDLTINAMAMDDDGTLIDPFHGATDLRNQCFRHVSPAFIEDPVRVLRVARFAARYHHLGFTLANETRCLMASMVHHGELSHLVPERVWQEFSRSLTERTPQQFILVLRACGALSVVIPELDALFGIPISPAVCPLVDSGQQALYGLTKIAAQSMDPVLRFAGLCHVLGNTCTPMSAWPNHDVVSTDIIQQKLLSLCKRLRIPNEYAHLACMTARFCSIIQRLLALSADDIVTTLEQCDAFRRPSTIAQLGLIADTVAHFAQQKQAHHWQLLLDRCCHINIPSLIAKGHQGQGIKMALHQERVNAVAAWKIKHEKQ